MKKLPLVFALFLAMAFAVAGCHEEEEQGGFKPVDIDSVAPSDTVFICTGRSAKRFHAIDSCSGLSKCTKEINGLTKAQAMEKKRTPCDICFKVHKK